MGKLIGEIDRRIIDRFKKLESFIARLAIFVVYFWFGLLKFLGLSPAEPLVYGLFDKTLGFLNFPVFFSFFALFEMAIGILFLAKGFERLAILFIGVHVFTTILPLVLLPEIAWQAAFVPTLAGQYIIKNILIAALAIVIGSRLAPIKSRN